MPKPDKLFLTTGCKGLLLCHVSRCRHHCPPRYHALANYSALVAPGPWGKQGSKENWYFHLSDHWNAVDFYCIYYLRQQDVSLGMSHRFFYTHEDRRHSLCLCWNTHPIVDVEGAESWNYYRGSGDI